ncbi:hypothetical protein MRX96_003089 [Rhipicephalus microplus]
MKLMPRAQTYSKYKAHNTVKFLVAIAPNGCIMYVSNVVGGRASGKFITADCGIENLLGHGDEIMADRGFSQSRNLELQGVNLNMPTFTKERPQLSEGDHRLKTVQKTIWGRRQPENVTAHDCATQCNSKASLLCELPASNILIPLPMLSGRVS